MKLSKTLPGLKYQRDYIINKKNQFESHENTEKDDIKLSKNLPGLKYQRDYIINKKINSNLMKTLKRMA